MHDKACGSLRVHFFRLMAVVFTVLMVAMPGRMWGADKDDETVIIDGKVFHVLRNNSDWERFRELVKRAEGNSEVNAIMDDDISVTLSVGLNDWPFYGTFDGNGHTLNVSIESSAYEYAAPFPVVKNGVFKNLHVTGTVNGALHSSGLVGSSTGSKIYIDNCRVSANVKSTKTHVGGFIGHGHKVDHVINNCLFDGTLVANNSSDSHGGAIIGWEEGGGTSNSVKNCLDKGKYINIRHAGFCYANNGGVYGNSATLNLDNWSYSNWGEMKGNVVGTKSADDLASALGTKNWQVVNGEVLPVMATYPSKEDVTMEANDLFPGTEQGEEGTVKIPITSDMPMLWIEGSYTNEDGAKVSVGRTELKKDSYVGFLSLPATEAHRDLTIKVKLKVGSVTLAYDPKMDAVIHNPRQLRAEMMDDPSKGLTDAGAVMLQWVTKEPEYKDVMEGDVFSVMRSLTGKKEDMENIGSVDVDNKLSTYAFKDSTLISALEAAHIDKNVGIPLVRYCVVRGSTQQLWGFDKNTTVAYVQPQMATLSLLEPVDAKAVWSNET